MCPLKLRIAKIKAASGAGPQKSWRCAGGRLRLPDGIIQMVKEKAMASLAAISPENIGGVDSLFSTGPRHDSAVDRRPVQLKPEKRIERYGHRAAVVLSSSRTLRSSLEQA